MIQSTLERGIKRRWKCRCEVDPVGSESRPTLAELVGSESRSTRLVERVLAARGLSDADACAAFLEPSLRGLHDPSAIPDLDKAAERLLAAAGAHEPIVIYGDYDVDGITATAILFHTLRAVAPDAPVSCYVPHRLDEGYGLNSEAIVKLAGEGARVIVSVDCGVTAHEPARAARDAGVDLVITDHHNPPATVDDLPDAYAVVHPRHPASAYPFGELCGAGVAYKLAWRIATLHSGSDRVLPALRELLVQMLGLCALGVIADVVPLVDENRVITKFGLPLVRSSPIAGMRALVDAAGLGKQSIDAEAVGFRIGPLLNACGRMGHAGEAVELLTTAGPERSEAIARDLVRLNSERRATERRIFRQAGEMAEGAGMTGEDKRAIVLAHEDWHPGVVGIVCSRLVERFGRPTILLQNQGKLCAGSGRSIDGFNLHGALEACAEHLAGFGGHDMAAGLRVPGDQMTAFVRALTDHANERLSPEDLLATLGYDCDARLGELKPDAVRQLDKLAPFGRSNPKVRLRIGGLRVASRPEPFGKTGNHLKVRLEDAGDRSLVVQVIGWGWAEHVGEIVAGSACEAIVTPKLNTWGGRSRVEPELCDLRFEI